MKPKRKRLTANSNAVKLFKIKLQSGELDGTEKAERVWRSESLFQKHKLDTFRACYNRIRKDMGLPLKDPALHIVPRTSLDPQRENDAIVIESDASNKDDKSYREEIFVDVDRNKWMLFDQLDWRPFYLISEWTEPETTTKRLSVEVVMPSGLQRGTLAEADDTSEDSTRKVVEPKWLNQSGEKYTDHHPELRGFESALKNIREQSKDRVLSTTKIILPFAVESQLVLDNIRFNCGSIVYYVRLRAFNESYA
ncbi:hypothetical protein FGB62_203g013 [Gracilaria domingensis]|nr:hypothetical protein FGB62_203g013 [Gracilaria domingensis]